MLKNLLDSLGEEYPHLLKERHIDAKTTLLREGEISHYMYIIREGCLRLWFNKNGRDITFQFFFENQAVSSMESFMNGIPSLFYMESIEPSRVIAIHKDDFDLLLKGKPGMKEAFQKILLLRLENYTRLFLSRIKDSAGERYIELIERYPQIAERVPQHYIASYLGITPVSLSRLKKNIR